VAVELGGAAARGACPVVEDELPADFFVVIVKEQARLLAKPDHDMRR
jgi:hypothetical protein